MNLTVNGNLVVLDEGDLLCDLLRQLEIPMQRPGMAIAVNDEVISKNAWTSLTLADGDRIEIIQAVQGG